MYVDWQSTLLYVYLTFLQQHCGIKTLGVLKYVVWNAMSQDIVDDTEQMCSVCFNNLNNLETLLVPWQFK